ncbi:hypothetical protein [Catellatospora sp. NPDC049609]|uniref:hypothetical protein n=1 Tax=Catellatospora sp. NPDC049609 TaxID=3155505 RepID=UPI00344635CE
MRRAALALLLALTGCAADPVPVVPAPSAPSSAASPASIFPRWRALGAAGLPTGTGAFEPERVAAGRHGFAMLSTDEYGRQGLFFSADGTAWTRTVSAFDRQARDLATDGRDVYLLVHDTYATEATVWTLRSGGGWEDAETLRSRLGPVESPGSWAVTAGPRGVVVAHVRDGRRVVELWASTGGGFERTEAATVDLHAEQRPYNLLSLQLLPTAAGPVAVYDRYGSLYAATAGELPAAVPQALPPNANVSRVAVNGSHWVVDGWLYEPLRPGDPGYLADDPTGENDRFRPATWCSDGSGGVATARVDGGRLPDLGVSGAHEAASVRPYRTGFLMVGSTGNATNQTTTPGVWWSPDGCAWHKDQVRANGFDAAERFTDVATTGESTLLAGGLRDAEGPQTRLWLGSGLQ